MIKFENQIYADLISLIKSALLNFKIENWKVCQLNQPIKFSETAPVIYVSIEGIKKRGSQFTRKKPQCTYSEAYKEEILVKISALRRSLPDDNVTTIGAKDILKLLNSWLLSSQGLKQVKSLGYSIFNPGEIRQVTFKNDSDNKVIMPSFDITFNIEQTWDVDEHYISGYKLKMKGI